RRARSDRDGETRRVLPGPAKRRAARGDRPPALGNAEGVRRRCLYPRLRPRALRQRPDARRRRRPEAVPVLRRLLTPWRAVGAIALLALIAFLVLYSVPSGAFSHQ